MKGIMKDGQRGATFAHNKVVCSGIFANILFLPDDKFLTVLDYRVRL